LTTQNELSSDEAAVNPPVDPPMVVFAARVAALVEVASVVDVGSTSSNRVIRSRLMDVGSAVSLTFVGFQKVAQRLPPTEKSHPTVHVSGHQTRVKNIEEMRVSNIMHQIRN
jgi:hypothetical protein